MLILFVYLVSMDLLMTQTEGNNVVIEIKAVPDQQQSCIIPNKVTLVENSNMTLEVRSHYLIMHGDWKRHFRYKRSNVNLHDLENTKFGITYERSLTSTRAVNNTFIYTYWHTQTVGSDLEGNWNFNFTLLKNYDPFDDKKKEIEQWTCHTRAKIDKPVGSAKPQSAGKSTETPPHDLIKPIGTGKWLIILVTVFGILLFVQTSFILYGKVRSCKSVKKSDEDPISPKSPKTKRGPKSSRSIADRPPLPLPVEAVTEVPPATAPMAVGNTYNNQPGPMAPNQSYRNKGLDIAEDVVKSPGFPRRQMEVPPATAPMAVGNTYNNQSGPLAPNQSYRNKGLDIAEDVVKSPGFPRRQMEGPLVPKKSFRNKALDHSEEELRAPGFPRRQIEGPLVPKQSFRNKALDHSEEELRTPGFARKQKEAKLAQLPPKAITSQSVKYPKPLPRSQPSPPPELPALHPAHRKELGPPLHPKQMQVFPPSALRRQPDPRISDEDWQYEHLQPASKYLNNFTNTPYDNL